MSTVCAAALNRRCGGHNSRRQRSSTMAMTTLLPLLLLLLSTASIQHASAARPTTTTTTTTTTPTTTTTTTPTTTTTTTPTTTTEVPTTTTTSTTTTSTFKPLGNKPGTCPLRTLLKYYGVTTPEYKILNCIRECKCDWDCAGTRKCCTYGKTSTCPQGAKLCVLPVLPTTTTTTPPPYTGTGTPPTTTASVSTTVFQPLGNKPGTCPLRSQLSLYTTNAAGKLSNCVRQCLCDWQCPGDQRCCYYACTNPTYQAGGPVRLCVRPVPATTTTNAPTTTAAGK